MTNLMGRFALLRGGLLPPAECFVCKRPESPLGFADTRHGDEWLGQFYLCGQCVMEMAGLFGMIGPEQAADLLRTATVAIDHAELLAERVWLLSVMRETVSQFVAAGGLDEPDDDGDPAAGRDAAGSTGGGRRGGGGSRNRKPAD